MTGGRFWCVCVSLGLPWNVKNAYRSPDWQETIWDKRIFVHDHNLTISEVLIQWVSATKVLTLPQTLTFNHIVCQMSVRQHVLLLIFQSEFVAVFVFVAVLLLLFIIFAWHFNTQLSQVKCLLRWISTFEKNITLDRSLFYLYPQSCLSFYHKLINEYIYGFSNHTLDQQSKKKKSFALNAGYEL